MVEQQVECDKLSVCLGQRDIRIQLPGRPLRRPGHREALIVPALYLLLHRDGHLREQCGHLQAGQGVVKVLAGVGVSLGRTFQALINILALIHIYSSGRETSTGSCLPATSAWRGPSASCASPT